MELNALMLFMLTKDMMADGNELSYGPAGLKLEYIEYGFNCSLQMQGMVIQYENLVIHSIFNSLVLTMVH